MSSVDVRDFDLEVFDALAHKEVAASDVFHTLMVLRVVGEVARGGIVRRQLDGLGGLLGPVGVGVAVLGRGRALVHKPQISGAVKLLEHSETCSVAAGRRPAYGAAKIPDHF